MIVLEEQSVLQFHMGLCAKVVKDHEVFNRGFYIVPGTHGIHYLHDDGVVRSSVSSKGASAFWPTEEEAIDFYEKWNQGQY